jgi:HAD superfamily hydrolase (TIGR01509 family)
VTAGGITFDFHNTIAACDDWFQLEVRHLVSSFLSWHARSHRSTVKPDQLAAADAAYRTLRQEIHVHGIEQTAEQCLVTVLDQIGIDVPHDDIARGVHELMRETAPQASPKNGVIETVRQLAALGVPLGIVSSAVYHPFLEWTLERFAIHDAFTVIVTSASSGFYKSRPEIYLRAADAMGIAASNIVHVGDSLRFDVGGAQRAGMRAVLVASERKPSSTGDPIPDLIVPSLSGAAPSIVALLTTPR